ncbi:MAG: Rid family detoxifying hydrolase [Sandaracinaceae bacterium]
MKREALSTPSAPAAIGPYSQGMRIGDLLFTSGQIAMDASTGELVAVDDVAAQAELVMDHLAAVLAAGGASFANVVKATIYLTDMADFGAVNAVYAKRFEGMDPPARACVEVSGLPKGVKVEIEMIAAVDHSG